MYINVLCSQHTTHNQLLEHNLLALEQCATKQLSNRVSNVCASNNSHRPLLPFAIPIQRNGYSARPSTQYGTDQTSVNLVNRQQKRHSLSPSLAIHTVYVDQRQRAQHRNVRASQKRVGVVRCYRSAEQDERGGE